MKVLLVGPYPPPHGGVSVHVASVARGLHERGVTQRVLDTSRASNRILFTLALVRFAATGWTIHFHANGHNWKDWSIAFHCGLLGRPRARSILTLHSGLTPDYLAVAPRSMRVIARRACALHGRVICVSHPIRESLLSIGVRKDSIEVAEAFEGTIHAPDVVLHPNLAAWMRRHHPVLSTTLFFRPEYGFDILVSALRRLRDRYPALGCVVMGTGEDRESAERLVRDAGLTANIFFAGDVDHDACLTVMSRSHVFVRGTLCDGDSISVREALALGVPVAASRTAFRPHGVTLFAAGDADAMADAIEATLNRELIEEGA
ncbi:MAG TPA: glycosyltransferase family 4 protein [Bryobacteraceae bacterium]|nr:glycosyltransferase family 4 protein [Bryobacteraceae bacterium]